MLLLETVGKDAIDFHRHLLLREMILVVSEDNLYEVTVFQMGKIVAILLHFTPKTKGTAIVNLYLCLDTCIGKCFLNLGLEFVEVVAFCFNVLLTEG